MTVLRVHLREDERAALLKLAQVERRDLAPQAALIIRRELERAGLLPADQPTPIKTSEDDMSTLVCQHCGADLHEVEIIINGLRGQVAALRSVGKFDEATAYVWAIECAKPVIGKTEQHLVEQMVDKIASAILQAVKESRVEAQ